MGTFARNFCNFSLEGIHLNRLKLRHSSRFAHSFARRFVTTQKSSSIPKPRRKFWTKFRVLTAVTTTSACAYLYWGYTNNIPLSLYLLGRPFLKFVDPEFAHSWTVWLASKGPDLRLTCGMIEMSDDPEILQTNVFGLPFESPIGLAAGFDKHGEAVDGMLDMGFGFVEIGSVTPLPQSGNPKPRLFRLLKERAVINRYGFNSEGHAAVADHMDARMGANRPSGVIGINLGKNKTSLSAVDDYCKGVETLGPYADYIVVNVSSPNTPGLRDLQGAKQLHELLTHVIHARDELHARHVALFPSNCDSCIPPRTPLLVKLAPDLLPEDMEDIAKVVLDVGVDGMVISNTTVTRPVSVKRNELWTETGGLSGAPLKNISTEVIRRMYLLTDGKIPIIGVGGVETGEDAYAKIRAGASLVQLYSALVFFGPKLVPRIKRELVACLERDGFASVEEAVGAEHRDLETKDE
eukprot:49276_1